MAAACLLVIAWLLALTLPTRPHFVQASDDTSSPAHVAGEAIIKFQRGTTRADQADCLGRMGALTIRRFEPIGAQLVRLSTLSVGQAIQRFRDHTQIEYIEPNFIVGLNAIPNDLDFAEQWGLMNTGQMGGIAGADISAVAAWDISTGSGEVVVAVVDSGVDYAHVDLAPNIYLNPGEIPDNGVDDDGNGYVDDVRGWNFSNGTNEVMDFHGHGTAIAGIIGALTNNSLGVAGVAWQVRILPVKWCSFHSGDLASALAAVEYATAMNVDIMNHSWGFDAPSPPASLLDMFTAANDAGILLVCAAGNSNHNLELYPHYPACLLLPLVISVAASNQQDFKPTFSNYGSTHVDLAAPGCDIYSTLPDDDFGFFGVGGPYIPGSGTSFAAPFVVGALALVKDRFPELTPLQTKIKLLQAVDPIPALEGVVLTGGRLNLHRALLAGDTIPPGPVSDFAIQQIADDLVILTWTAAGDDGEEGLASAYDIRCATYPIDEENFDEAPEADGDYATSLPGDNFRLRVDNLVCGQRYYFAIKAIDDAGNVSTLNTVSAETAACPPRVALSRGSLLLETRGHESVMQDFMLTNAGDGRLEYRIHTAGADWYHAAPDSGQLLGNESQTVAVVCDAAQLSSGEYTAVLRIASNDPDQSNLGLPVLLRVTGAPLVIPLSRTLPAGTAMLGAPLVPPVGRESWGDALLDDTAGPVTLLDYLEPGRYRVVDPGQAVTTGRGLWIQTAAPFSWTMDGDYAEPGVAVPLELGWTVVGYPRWLPSDLNVVTLDSLGMLKSWEKAVSAGWVPDVVWGYDSAAARYLRTTRLDPWHGYWIAGFVPDLVLRFFRPPQVTAQPRGLTPHKHQVEPLPGDCSVNWQVDVFLVESQQAISLGTHVGASDGFDPAWDLPIPPPPPGGHHGPSLHLWCPAWRLPTGSEFRSDLRAPAPESLRWTAVLQSSTPIRVTLTWDIHDLPDSQDLQIWWLDQDGLLVESLRVQSSVQLDLGSDPLFLQIGERLPGGNPPQPALNLHNVPNPFNARTTFRFNLPHTGDVELGIYSPKGNRIRTLCRDAMPAGAGALVWNGRDGQGLPAASGVYVYRLSLDGLPVGPTRKLLLVK